MCEGEAMGLLTETDIKRLNKPNCSLLPLPIRYRNTEVINLHKEKGTGIYGQQVNRAPQQSKCLLTCWRIYDAFLSFTISVKEKFVLTYINMCESFFF